MDKLRDKITGDSPPVKSMINDVKRLKTEASLTTAELCEFVRGLKGRSPQEVMGMITGNALTRAMVWSTVGCVSMLIVLSVPFAFGSSAKAKAAKAKSAQTAKAKPEPTKNEAKEAKADSSEGDAPSEANLKKASKAMGLDETKTADPKKNPLDRLDNLLDKNTLDK